MWIGEAPRHGFLSFAFAPNGTIYTGDDLGSVLAWDRQTNDYQELFELPKINYGRQAVWRLELAPEADRLFVPVTRKVHVLDLPDGTPGRHLRNTSSMMPRVGFSPDGSLLVTVSSGNRVTMWDVRTLEPQDVPGPLGRVRGVAFVAFVGNGSRVLVIRQVNEEVSVWDANTGERVGEVSTKEIWCRACALSSDRSAFAACVVGGSEVRVFGLPDWIPRATIRHNKPIEGLALHPTGEFLAVTDGTRNVALWNTTTGTKIGEWNWRIGDVRGIAFAPDGLTCAVGGVGRFVVFDVDL